MPQPHNYWLNGIVKVNGNDLMTFGCDVDGPIKIDMNVNQISHAGSGPVDRFTDETKNDTSITISGAVLSMRMLNYILGMAKTTGVSEDGSTPASLYSFNGDLDNYGRRPYVELLVQGNRPGTINAITGEANKVEIWALRAKLMGVFSVNMDKDNYTKLELVFKLHADPDDKTVTWFQIRDEAQQS